MRNLRVMLDEVSFSSACSEVDPLITNNHMPLRHKFPRFRQGNPLDPGVCVKRKVGMWSRKTTTEQFILVFENYSRDEERKDDTKFVFTFLLNPSIASTHNMHDLWVTDCTLLEQYKRVNSTRHKDPNRNNQNVLYFHNISYFVLRMSTCQEVERIEMETDHKSQIGSQSLLKARGQSWDPEPQPEVSNLKSQEPPALSSCLSLLRLLQQTKFSLTYLL